MEDVRAAMTLTILCVLRYFHLVQVRMYAFLANECNYTHHSFYIVN